MVEVAFLYELSMIIIFFFELDERLENGSPI